MLVGWRGVSMAGAGYRLTGGAVWMNMKPTWAGLGELIAREAGEVDRIETGWLGCWGLTGLGAGWPLGNTEKGASLSTDSERTAINHQARAGFSSWMD